MDSIARLDSLPRSLANAVGPAAVSLGFLSSATRRHRAGGSPNSRRCTLLHFRTGAPGCVAGFESPRGRSPGCYFCHPPPGMALGGANTANSAFRERIRPERHPEWRMGLMRRSALAKDTGGGIWRKSGPRQGPDEHGEGFDPVRGLGYAPPARRPGARVRRKTVGAASSRLAASTTLVDETHGLRR